MNNPLRFQQQSQDESGNYYVSITDMVIGLLFIFILLLMYFALQLRDTTQDLLTSEQTRNELLMRVAGYLSDHDVEASVDLTAGVLRLPNEILFDKGADTPKPAGVEVMGVLADALVYALPCYTYSTQREAQFDCPITPHRLDAIFIEGHTDNEPVTPSPRIRNNWDLSAARASNTLQILTSRRSELYDFRAAPASERGEHSVFSIAGYADQRPIVEEEGNLANAGMNRRIDLRFVMAPPRPEELQPTRAALERDPNRTAVPIAIGERVAFNMVEQSDPYLQSGWSGQEPWGAWTVGPSAGLILPVSDPAADQAYELVFELIAYVPTPSPERNVDIFINGQRVLEDVYVGPRNRYTRSIPLPAGTFTDSSELDIIFEVKNPVSPRELNLSQDARPLGVGLVALEIDKAR